MDVFDNVTMSISGGEMTSSPPLYYGSENIVAFGVAYSRVHGYIASAICLVGIPVNLINAAVLTRAKMLTPCNLILAAMATSDVLTMLIYLPFALHFYCVHGPESSVERNTLAAARYMLFFACFSIVAHSSSLWLTVVLGAFRYMNVRECRQRSADKSRSLTKAKVVVAAVYAVTFLMCVPNFCSITIAGHPKNDIGGTVWVISFRYDTPLEQSVYHINFWVQAIMMKILPGVILFVFIVLLIHTLKSVRNSRRQRYIAAQRLGTTMVGMSPAELRRIKETNRPTRLLIIILVMFLVTEIPQGIIILLSGVLPKFLEEVYIPLGDFMDILALANNSVTFVLYCAMSKRFQNTMVELFCCFSQQQEEKIISAKKKRQQSMRRSFSETPEKQKTYI